MNSGLQQFLESTEQSVAKANAAFYMLAGKLARGDDVDKNAIAKTCGAAEKSPDDLLSAIEMAKALLRCDESITIAIADAQESAGCFRQLVEERDRLADEAKRVKEQMIELEVAMAKSLNADESRTRRCREIRSAAMEARNTLIASGAEAFGITVRDLPPAALSPLVRHTYELKWDGPWFQRAVHDRLFPPRRPKPLPVDSVQANETKEATPSDITDVGLPG